MIVGWMQFAVSKAHERAHVFRPTPGDPRLMDSLCGRWRVRTYSQAAGIATLEAAADDRPRCKSCEKKLTNG